MLPPLFNSFFFFFIFSTIVLAVLLPTTTWWALLPRRFTKINFNSVSTHDSCAVNVVVISLAPCQINEPLQVPSRIFTLMVAWCRHQEVMFVVERNPAESAALPGKGVAYFPGNAILACLSARAAFFLIKLQHSFIRGFEAYWMLNLCICIL